MSGENDWSPNYCLNCDRETAERHYCSQACRLADMEKSAISAPVTPGFEYHQSLSFAMSPGSRSNIIQLPPAFDFSAYRHASSKLESPPVSPRAAQSSASQYSYRSASSQHLYSQTPAPLQRSRSDYPQGRQRSLNTSTSRTSLSSISSTGSAAGLSGEALSQLQSYSYSFDHVRDWKRRLTLQ